MKNRKARIVIGTIKPAALIPDFSFLLDGPANNGLDIRVYLRLSAA
jgi:hypothetical protein